MTTSFAPVPSLTDTNNRESGWHGAAELHIKPRRRAGGRIKQRGWSVQNSAVGGVHGSRCRPAHEWHEASTSQDSLATGFPGSGRWRRIRGRRCGPNFISCRWLGSCAPLTISSLSLMAQKIDFFSRAIDGKTPLPSDQAWSRASKKVGPSVSIDQEPEKCESDCAENGPFPHTHTNEVACV